MTGFEAISDVVFGVTDRRVGNQIFDNLVGRKSLKSRGQKSSEA